MSVTIIVINSSTKATSSRYFNFEFNLKLMKIFIRIKPWLLTKVMLLFTSIYIMLAVSLAFIPKGMDHVPLAEHACKYIIIAHIIMFILNR